MIFANNTLSFIVTVLFAVAFGLFYQPPPPAATPVSLLRALDKVAAVAKDNTNLTIALGYNVCVDLIVPAKEVLRITPEELAQSADLATLRTEADVNRAFAHFAKAGAAAERTCDPAVFQQLVQRALASPTARRSLGGNAALMARKLAKLGFGAPAADSGSLPAGGVMVGGHIGPDAAALLPGTIIQALPPADGDEVHLILEYSSAEEEAWPGAGFKAVRSNRFIVTADAANTQAGAMVDTIHVADAAQVHALVVAGLHMLEPLAPAARLASLAAIRAALMDRATPFAVHLELASSADAAYTASLANYLFPLADSVGFNEQESAWLYEALGGAWLPMPEAKQAKQAKRREAAEGELADAAEVLSTPAVPGLQLRESVASATAPHPVSVAALLRWLMERFPRLTRLHYHSLAFHLTAHRNSSAWRQGRASVAAGAVAAAVEACNTTVAGAEDGMLFSWSPLSFDTADPARPAAAAAAGCGMTTGTCGSKGSSSSEEPHTVRRLTPRSPVARWSWGSSAGPIDFALAPVPACKKPASTVGLGDAISAAGLGADIRPRTPRPF